MHAQDLDELKNDVERAFKAALSSMDYSILRIIIESSKEGRSACEKKDYQSMTYAINRGFWDIGVCINRKLNNYTSVMPEFFENISSNIRHYLNRNTNVAFSPENLKRCLKLVNLASEPWFERFARTFTWQHFADAIDKSDSFDDLQACFLGNIQCH